MCVKLSKAESFHFLQGLEKQLSLFTCHTWPTLPLPRPDSTQPAGKLCESQSRAVRVILNWTPAWRGSSTAPVDSDSDWDSARIRPACNPRTQHFARDNLELGSCCFRSSRRASDVSPGGAAGLLLSGYRGIAARRAVLPKPTPRLVRFFARRRRRLPAVAARAAAAVAGLVAAAARRLHGGAVLWSSVPQQLTLHPKLLSLLGWLLGRLTLATGVAGTLVHGGTVV